ncbi:hypothetical protein SBBP2_960004 [Burkholderiales bacterium]|nr:hypothetical protein SBBP2_960004 [Burkholderiales bacterium]
MVRLESHDSGSEFDITTQRTKNSIRAALDVVETTPAPVANAPVAMVAGHRWMHADPKPEISALPSTVRSRRGRLLSEFRVHSLNIRRFAPVLCVISDRDCLGESVRIAFVRGRSSVRFSSPVP